TACGVPTNGRRRDRSLNVMKKHKRRHVKKVAAEHQEYGNVNSACRVEVAFTSCEADAVKQGSATHRTQRQAANGERFAMQFPPAPPHGPPCCRHGGRLFHGDPAFEGRRGTRRQGDSPTCALACGHATWGFPAPHHRPACGCCRLTQTRL